MAGLILEGLVGFVPVDAWDLFALGIIGAGYGGAIGLVLSGLIHQRAPDLALFQLLLPAYWLLHSIATLYAVGELITAPTRWAKTTHGVTRVTRAAARDGVEVLRPRTG